MRLLAIITLCAVLVACGDSSNKTSQQPSTPISNSTTGEAASLPDDVIKKQNEIQKEIVAAEVEMLKSKQSKVANQSNVELAPGAGSKPSIERLPAPFPPSGPIVSYNIDVVKNEIKVAIEGIKALQPVFFATNRKIIEGPDFQLASITSDRGSKVTYGLAAVSVPKNHRIGHVERPRSYLWGWIKNKETDEDSFRMKGLKTLSDTEFVSALREDSDSVMVFVHGYNVTFADAVFKAAQDANFGGTTIVFSWPSAGELIKYDRDRESANFSPGDLFNLLKLVTSTVPSKKIYVVAHSLGSQVVVDALQQAALSNVKLKISELVFAAPDIDKDVFMSKASQIKSVAGNVTIYASSVDRALLASNRKAWGSRMGYIDTNGPHLIDGFETIDVTAVGDDMLGLNHGTFSASRAVLDDLGRIIISGVHPPNLRSPTLRLMPDKENPKYWMYPR